MPKVCLECDSALKGKQEKFCSKRCRKSNWKKNKGRKITNEWQKQYFRKKARSNWIDIECIWCRKMFKPSLMHKNQQRYCSKSCSDSIVRRVARQNARVKKLYNITDSLKVKDWLEILERDKRSCQICGSNVKIEMDHIIPLSKGGSHTKNNIRVSCRKCNRRNDTTFKSNAALQT